ncbi:hypothetical protein H0I31_02150 [Tenacibaculum sp. AHE15PA]|uniref:hypothetical protein n=1 Tax=unclassified Tenacibaculum TaxID=2635139 RepID=UPI001C4EE6B0|nr:MULTISPECIES: hypothetical protein [unclassified Tenacibaculum]QXP72524.1 hypothetical protein H0I30_07405 [Tenacibaculum sp. AHE14PA]QXP76439.1 hypothetical protein H0I31_02150 [Tenacibaculum sp. AHE15PA]
MEVFFKIIFIIVLLLIFYQDIKERKVTFLLFILGIILGGFAHYINSLTQVFLINIVINIVVIIIIYLILFLYTKFFLNKKLLETIGLGDFLFFLLLAVSFPSIAFLVFFSTSLIFSLLLFLILKSSLKIKTLPLAGLQAFFISLVLILNWFFNFVDIYAL